MDTQTITTVPVKTQHQIDEENRLKNIARRAAHAAAEAEWLARQAAQEAAIEEAKVKITTLLDQQSIWDRDELQTAVGMGDAFIFALSRLDLHHGNCIHRKTKEL